MAQAFVKEKRNEHAVADQSFSSVTGGSRIGNATADARTQNDLRSGSGDPRQGFELSNALEWTSDGRLLVSERNGGRVVDITDGGDAREAKVVVDGLEGPASILPLEDRILIAETWAGRVASVVEGQRTEYFATGLSWPYSLAALSKNGYRRIVVSEYIGLMRGQITDITSGGARDAFVPYVTDVPYPTPITYKAPGSEMRLPRPEILMGCQNAPWTAVWDDGRSIWLFVEANHIIFQVPPEGGSFFNIITDEQNVLATGLKMTGGMIQHPSNGQIYAVNPAGGYVFAVDPEQPGDYRHQPPVVAGLNWPTCVRFSPDGEDMYVCSFGSGVIYRIRNYA